LWKNKARNLAFYAIGFSKVGIEDVFDDNENGSILGTFDDEIKQETNDFFVSEAEGDPDCPSKGYSSIEHALNALCQGKVSYNHCL
jgi:3,4-dihydroxy 2-butanone 4-phosphate synthase/GTP cyclohydrolase II